MIAEDCDSGSCPICWERKEPKEYEDNTGNE